MVRVFAVATFLLVASPAVADWVRVHDNNEWTSYLDPATLQRVGDTRKQWLLQDRKRRGKHGELSKISFVEFDCREGRLRELTSAIYYNPMGSGDIISSAAAKGDWIYVPPQSYGLDLLRYVCAK